MLIPTVIPLKYMMSVPSMWPIGPLVKVNETREVLHLIQIKHNCLFIACVFLSTTA